MARITNKMLVAALEKELSKTDFSKELSNEEEHLAFACFVKTKTNAGSNPQDFRLS